MKNLITLIKIFLLIIVTYIVIVFISHFSVNSQNENYKISQSFDAMIFKGDSPATFFAYYLGSIAVIVLIFSIINIIVSRKTKLS